MSGLLDIRETSIKTLKVEPLLSPQPTINNKSSAKPGEKSSSPRLPTIDYLDFSSLLNPKNVDCCVCCSTNLLSSSPPSLFIERKSEVLKSFCDILNLPFSLRNNNNSSNSNDNEDHESDEEEESEDSEDFPFCFHCTNHKVLKLTLLYDKLQLIQNQFEQLKEALMKDILRVFLNNLVMQKKLPVKVVRESSAFDRMFYLFKRHSERKIRNTTDSESQTDPVYFSTPYIPVPVASLSVSSGNINKRRKVACKKYEPYVMDNNTWSRKRKSSNMLNPHSPATNNEYNDVPEENIYLHHPIGHHKQSISSKDESVSVDSAINGTIFSFGDNGLLDLDEKYLSSIDFTKSGAKRNGLSLDHASLREEFHNVLGMVDGMDTDGSVSVEVPLEQIVARKSSPNFPNDDNNYTSKSKKKKTKSRTKISTCEICNKSMLSQTLKMHMEHIHGDSKPKYSCRGCDKKFARRDHYKQHEERHIINSKRIYFCHRCGEDSDIITSKSSYVSHVVSKHNVEDDVVEYFHFCDADDCNQSFKVREDFLNHLATHREPGVNLRCTVCEKSFAEKKRLEAHERDAHRSNDPYYDCQFCYKGFEEETDFSRHILFHKVKIPEEFNYACDMCDTTYETENRLRRHKYNVHVRSGYKYKRKRASTSVSVVSNASHQSQNDEEDAAAGSVDVKSVVAAETPEIKNDLTCNTCGKTFIHKKRYKKHLLKHPIVVLKTKVVEINNKVKEEPLEQHTATVPKLKIITKDRKISTVPEEESNNENHNSSISNNTTPEKPLVCKYCRRKLRTKQEVRRHMVKSHPDEHLKGGKLHSCVVCYHLFDTEDELEDHCNEKHSRFKCSQCGKQLMNTLFLNHHLKAAHGIVKSQAKVHTRKKSDRKKVSKTTSVIDQDDDDEEDLLIDQEALSPVKNLDQDSYDAQDAFQIY